MGHWNQYRQRRRALRHAGDTAKKIGKDYNGSVDVTIDKGVALLASRKDADAV
ncbi:MAG: hypothetical protein ACLU9S_23565 [Oscillospiraceae bacterium]